MSCDWHIHCVDCRDTYRFDDANHESLLMLRLCGQADALAAVADVIDALKPDVQLTAGCSGRYGEIDLGWFRAHLGHQLLPIDEYGRVMNQCYGYARCSTCSHPEPCVLQLNHEGPHEAAKKEPRP